MATVRQLKKLAALGVICFRHKRLLYAAGHAVVLPRDFMRFQVARGAGQRIDRHERGALAATSGAPSRSPRVISSGAVGFRQQTGGGMVPHREPEDIRQYCCSEPGTALAPGSRPLSKLRKIGFPRDSHHAPVVPRPAAQGGALLRAVREAFGSGPGRRRGSARHARGRGRRLRATIRSSWTASTMPTTSPARC